MNIYQTLNTQTLYKIATYTLVRKKDKLYFPPNSSQTKPRKFIKKIPNRKAAVDRMQNTLHIVLL